MKGAAPLSAAIDDLLAALGLSGISLQVRLGARWDAVVGPLLAERTAPVRLRRGILTVAAENHTVSQELQFMKPALIRNAAALLGSETVSEVRIVVGPVPRPPREPAHDAAGAPTLSGAPPGDDPAGEIRREDPPADPEGLDAVPDAETRRILRALSRKAALRARNR